MGKYNHREIELFSSLWSDLPRFNTKSMNYILNEKYIKPYNSSQWSLKLAIKACPSTPLFNLIRSQSLLKSW